MTRAKKKHSRESFQSKYTYLDKTKLDDLYLTNLMRELWAVPIDQLDEFLKTFYPNPTVMEQIEINDIKNIIKRARSNRPLTDEDQKVIQYKHTRMYGKPRQIVELSGRDGEAIELSSLSDDKLKKEMDSKIKRLKTALDKLKSS